MLMTLCRPTEHDVLLSLASLHACVLIGGMINWLNIYTDKRVSETDGI